MEMVICEKYIFHPVVLYEMGRVGSAELENGSVPRRTHGA
jgi:hypothetical protein